MQVAVTALHKPGATEDFAAGAGVMVVLRACWQHRAKAARPKLHALAPAPPRILQLRILHAPKRLPLAAPLIKPLRHTARHRPRHRPRRPRRVGRVPSIVGLLRLGRLLDR